MKKVFPILIVLGVFAVALQFLVNFFMSSHSIEYSIITDDNEYMIKENFFSKNNRYVFEINDNKKGKYVFDFFGDYNKQEEIIRDLKYFTNDKLSCILPIYKNDNVGSILCNYDGDLISYSHAKKIDSASISKFEKSLKKQGYVLNYMKNDSFVNKVSNFTVNQKNIPDNVIFTMWVYKGFYIIDKKESLEKLFLNKDSYENSFTALVDNFYIFPDTDHDSNFKYSEIYIYDIKNGGKLLFDLDNPISKKSYINGIYDGNLYFTDLDNEVQYSLDPSLEKVREVGNKKDGFKSVVKDELKKVDSSKFLSDKNYFYKDSCEKIDSKYSCVDYYREGDYHYFLTNKGEVYRIINDNFNNPTLLFEFDNISDWKVHGRNVMVVVGDTMYYYDDVYGLLPILKNNELIYNYENICDFFVI